MPRIFAITAPTDRIALDASGLGEVTFTATNTSGRAIRAGAKAVALEGVTQDWLAISGEAERDFAARGSHQYVVQVAVRGAGAGRYSFRLDASSVTNPNEEFDEGPTVVGQRATVEPRKQSVPRWLVPLVTLALIVGVGLVSWYFLRDRRIAIPSAPALARRRRARPCNRCVPDGPLDRRPISRNRAWASPFGTSRVRRSKRALQSAQVLA